LTYSDSGSATYPALYTSSATTDNNYIIEILDGRYIGLVAFIKTNSGSTITVDEAELPTDGLLVGSKYVIRKDWTLASLFGAGSVAPLNSGTSAASGDTISIFNQKTQSYSPFYIRTSDKSWRNAVGDLSTHRRIPYGQGVQTLLRGASGTLTLSGDVRTARLRRDVLAKKFALFANLSPSATTLGDMNITIDRASSLAGSVVRVWNSTTGAWKDFYRRSTDGRFHDGIAVQDAFVVGAGKVVQVVNRGGDKKGETAITADPRLP
jgi:hypothetical protein